MAQYRQSGMERAGARNGSSDHVSIGIHAPLHKQSRSRRSSKARRVFFRYVLLLSVVVSLLVIVFLARDHLGEVDSYNHFRGKGIYNDTDFLSNFSLPRSKILMFGHSSITHGRDSRYWDKDDRRRDEGYNEDTAEHSFRAALDGKADKGHDTDVHHGNEKFTFNGAFLSNEGEHNNIKTYDASVRYNDRPKKELREQKLSGQIGADVRDEYDDGFDYHDVMEESYNGTHVNVHADIKNHIREVQKTSSNVFDSKGHDRNAVATVDMGKGDSSQKFENKVIGNENIEHIASLHHSTRKVDSEKTFGLKKKPKHHKFSGSSCEMKLLNSTSQLVKPLESRKFSRFVLHYTNTEEKPDGTEDWEPKFAGHQSLEQRERSFLADGNKINCGFVRSPEGSTGFDLAVVDKNYMNSCRIAVISCIFGNSDRLRSPTGKSVSQASRKSVCFVMFTDEISLQTLSSEGQAPDSMGFIGLWKVVVVKNLPYDDMRRVGKIPKLLAHRLFTSARYSIWLDSKLRLQLDPLLVLEYLLWRRGYEYAISIHYDRHCLWEEVAQNKKLNKYNHTVIDQQFEFYQADGMKRFNSSDPNKLLPSNVPEGSFIVRAHTPMSNLFSCLWFNEVERFTPRDQLSFAYTYQKLTRMNPMKPFYLNMFKDCERRTIAKLFHHRADEKRRVPAKVTD